MLCLVTGAAGFIGSHLVERLLSDGHAVLGVDALLDYYPRRSKERNLARARRMRGFTFMETDLLRADLPELLKGVEVVYHLAAQPGVRTSWGGNFRAYVENNVMATQMLLEACVGHGLDKFVYASSSSIYGNTTDLPTTEESVPKPVSPYGVSKLAGEHLAKVYHESSGVPTIALRYYTVYGPRQRPDMAFHRWIRALLTDSEIVVYGDGHQTRDFTFVHDVVDATVRAADCQTSGIAINVAGGARVDMIEVLGTLEALSSRSPRLRFAETQRGDPLHTWADTAKAERVLGFEAQTPLQEGLAAQLEDMAAQLS